MTEKELIARAATELEDAAERVGSEGYFSAAKDYLDTAARLRELIATQPQKQEDGE